MICSLFVLMYHDCKTAAVPPGSPHSLVRKKVMVKGFASWGRSFVLGRQNYFLKAPLRRLTYISMARPGLCCYPQRNTGPEEWGYYYWLRPITFTPLLWGRDPCHHLNKSRLSSQEGQRQEWISSRQQMVSLTVGKCILSLIQQIFIEHLLGHSPRFTKIMIVMMMMMCWEGGGDTGMQTITVRLPLTTKWKSLHFKKT